MDEARRWAEQGQARQATPEEVKHRRDCDDCYEKGRMSGYQSAMSDVERHMLGTERLPEGNHSTIVIDRAIADAIALATAGAFEAASFEASRIWHEASGRDDGFITNITCMTAIRALTPADVKAAQERHDAQVRLEEMALWKSLIDDRIAKLQRIAEGGHE